MFLAPAHSGREEDRGIAEFGSRKSRKHLNMKQPERMAEFLGGATADYAGMDRGVEQIPDVGDLTTLSDAELWTRIELEGSNIRRFEREIADREGYLTAARYRRGLLLLELKRRCAHGDFETECKARKVKSQRASEDIRIAEYFPNEAEAGKISVPKALKLIKRSDDSYGPYENCFACPQWLRDAVTRDYGFPGLDVASSHGMHFGEKFYTPMEDGLAQDWTRDCGGRIVWCNPPYNASVLQLWVKYAWEQSQNGCVVVAMLPFWRNYDWFWRYVKPFAEVQIPGDMVVLNGFGPKTGKQCGNVRGPTDYETIIAVFRKGQAGFLSGWIEAEQTIETKPEKRILRREPT
jgi:hypothetical protein